jgi:glycosyltransferase involved in cell wall biosynthesis
MKRRAVEPSAKRTPSDHFAIVVPCYNEAEIIDRFFAELVRALDPVDSAWRVYFIDDGSTDATLERLNALARSDHRIRVYSLSRNFGHQVALSAGLDVTLGSAAVMMDADLQHPPALLPQMVALWHRGFDVVSAVREETEGSTWFKRVTAAAFYRLINRVGEMSVVPGAADFCLLSARAHAAVCAMPERHRFLRGMVSWIGFERTYVRYQAPRRPCGRSKYTTVKMVGLALDALFSFSAAPMRMATRLGLALLVPGTLYCLYILARYLVMDDFVRGWGSLIGTLMIIGGTQLVFLGIIGEYLARIFEESKRRPLYFFKQTPDHVDD